MNSAGIDDDSDYDSMYNIKWKAWKNSRNRLYMEKDGTLWSTWQYISFNLTFMLPCIVIDFFLNNQPDALIIQIYSVIYMFRASSLPIIRIYLLYIRHW